MPKKYWICEMQVSKFATSAHIKKKKNQKTHNKKNQSLFSVEVKDPQTSLHLFINIQ